jgi:hypothetical protein
MSLPGIGLPEKMLIYAVGSRNVYENKGNMDEMTAKRSDIYGNMTWILQKNSGCDGQFCLNDQVFSLLEHGPAAELRWRRRDFEKTLGSVGGHRHERQCLRHPPAITKGAISSSRDVKNETTSGDVYENTRPW